MHYLRYQGLETCNVVSDPRQLVFHQSVLLLQDAASRSQRLDLELLAKPGFSGVLTVAFLPVRQDGCQ
jgi:hypothetical protein